MYDTELVILNDSFDVVGVFLKGNHKLSGLNTRSEDFFHSLKS